MDGGVRDVWGRGQSLRGGENVCRGDVGLAAKGGAELLDHLGSGRGGGVDVEGGRRTQMWGSRGGFIRTVVRLETYAAHGGWWVVGGGWIRWIGLMGLIGEAGGW